MPGPTTIRTSRLPLPKSDSALVQTAKAHDEKLDAMSPEERLQHFETIISGCRSKGSYTNGLPKKPRG